MGKLRGSCSQAAATGPPTNAPRKLESDRRRPGLRELLKDRGRSLCSADARSTPDLRLGTSPLLSASVTRPLLPPSLCSVVCLLLCERVSPPGPCSQSAVCCQCPGPGAPTSHTGAVQGTSLAQHRAASSAYQCQVQ